MSDKQQRRAEIPARLSDGKVSTEQAAGLLGVTDRQVRGQLARCLSVGMASVVHGNVGRAPANEQPGLLGRCTSRTSAVWAR